MESGMPPRPEVAVVEEEDEKPAIPLSPWRRRLVLFTVSWNCLPVIFTSTGILTTAPEVAAEFGTTTTSISTVNAMVFVGMALCPLFWGPLTNLVGRRTAILLANGLLCACLVAASASPSLEAFALFWIIGGTITPFFLIAGQTIVADVYQPTIRGTATGVFLGTCNTTTVLAPLVGAVIGTFTSWRAVFGVSAGITLLAFVLCYFFVPVPIQRPAGSDESDGHARDSFLMTTLRAFDPSPLFGQWMNPRVLFSDLTCGMLAFNMFGLLSSVRRVINPRFGLTSPLVSGVFYFAPGGGFLVGSIIGGRISDRVVKYYIRKRGVRIPHDRLRSSLPASLLILPFGTLLYGWSLEKEVGGAALPVISAFIEGVGLMASFSAVNTYSSEVVPDQRAAVISGKYLVQYFFTAAGVGSAVRMIDAVGVGWSFTITAAVAMTGGIFLAGIALLGGKVDALTLQEKTDEESDSSGVLGDSTP